MAVIVNFRMMMDSPDNPRSTSTCMAKEALGCCEAMPSQGEGPGSLEPRLLAVPCVAGLLSCTGPGVGGCCLLSSHPMAFQYKTLY